MAMANKQQGVPVQAVEVAFSHSLRIRLADGTAVDLVPIGQRVDAIPALRDRVLSALQGLLALAQGAAAQPPAPEAVAAPAPAQAAPRGRGRKASADGEEF